MQLVANEDNYAKFR